MNYFFSKICKILISCVLLIGVSNAYSQDYRQHFVAAPETSPTTLTDVVTGAIQTGSPIVNWASSSLSFPATNGMAVSGGRVTLGGTSTTSSNSYANLPLGVSYTGGSVFVSFLFRANIASSGNSTDASSNFLFYLGNSYAGTNGTAGAAGSRTAMMHVKSNGTNIQFGVTKSGNENQSVSNGVYNLNTSTFTNNSANLASTRTFFIVIEYRFISGTTNDEVRMWLFSDNQTIPSSASVPTAGVITAGDNTIVQDIQSINQIGLTYGINSARNVNAEFDAFNVGTSWQDVIPHVRTSSVLSDFGNVNTGSESSTSQTINLRGNALATGANIAVTPPTDFMISEVSGGNFTRNAINFDVSQLNNSTGKNIFVKFAPLSNSTTGAKTGNVTITASGVPTQNVAVSGTATAPTPTIRVQTANGIDIPNNDQNSRVTITGNPGNVLAFNFNLTNTGTGNLTGSVALTGSGFSLTAPSPATFTQAPLSNATLITSTFSATTVGTFDATISITSNTSVVANQTYIVYIRANIIAPILTATPATLTFAQTTGGQVSAPQTYTLTGSNFTTPVNITIDAPTNFQIALGTGANITYSNSVSVLSSTLFNSSQVISVRFAPTLLIPTGNVTGNITHTGYPNSNTTVALSASAVTELEKWDANFQILGNPTSDFIRIKCDNPAQWQNAQVSFTTLEGKQNFISKWENANTILEINASKWQKGLYILNIQQGSKIVTQKIILKD